MISNVQRVDFTNRTIIPDKSGGQVADLENGYLRLANQIQDAVCKVELSGREFRVLNAVIRLTYGWSKKEDRITNSLISDKTGLAVKHVSEAILTLAARHIILLRRIGQTRYIGINTELHRWAYGKPKCKSCITSFTKNAEENCYLIEIIIPENGDGARGVKTIPENRDNHPQKQGEASLKIGNTKDILTKTEKHKDIKPPIVPQESNLKPKAKPKQKTSLDAGSAEIPEWLSRETWLSWVSYRKEIGKTIKSSQTITQAINVLTKSREIGYQPEEIINQSIASGWVGIFVPKQPKAPTKHVTKSAPENFSGKDYGQTDLPAWAE